MSARNAAAEPFQFELDGPMGHATKWVPPSCLQICGRMGQQHQQLFFHQCPHPPDLQYLLQDLLQLTFGKQDRYQEISNRLQISTGVQRIYDLFFVLRAT